MRKMKGSAPCVISSTKKYRGAVGCGVRRAAKLVDSALVCSLCAYMRPTPQLLVLLFHLPSRLRLWALRLGCRLSCLGFRV